MTYVHAKKHLGQHFLKDENIARKIVESLTGHGDYKNVLEIGPGTGVLTKYLLEEKKYDISVVEVDRESVEFLKQNYPQLKGKIIEGDFLRIDLDSFFQIAHQTESTPGEPVQRQSPPFGGTKGGRTKGGPAAIIGNFPYNISSQIFFKVLEHRNQVPEVVCMLQKEVAQRIASPPGSKEYGILSVLLTAFYDIEYLFTVNETVFIPPPKVKSAVIRLKRNSTVALDCDEKQFFALVKAGFNQRRKTLRNALKSFTFAPGQEDGLFTKRAEQLTVAQFAELARLLT